MFKVQGWLGWGFDIKRFRDKGIKADGSSLQTML